MLKAVADCGPSQSTDSSDPPPVIASWITSDQSTHADTESQCACVSEAFSVVRWAALTAALHLVLLASLGRRLQTLAIAKNAMEVDLVQNPQTPRLP